MKYGHSKYKNKTFLKTSRRVLKIEQKIPMATPLENVVLGPQKGILLNCPKKVEKSIITSYEKPITFKKKRKMVVSIYLTTVDATHKHFGIIII